MSNVIEQYLSNLSTGIECLDISEYLEETYEPEEYNNIRYIPDTIIRFQFLVSLTCVYLHLERLPTLPDTLEHLCCDTNHLQHLIVPPNLQQLYCRNNLLTELVVPDTLELLYCANNQIANIFVGVEKRLPEALHNFNCINNRFTELPAFPATGALESLICSHNQIAQIETLPDTIIYFTCNNNIGIRLPLEFPEKLKQFDCSCCGLTALPILPTNLLSLNCGRNPLATIKLPPGLLSLNMLGTHITKIPEIPATLHWLEVDFTDKCFDGYKSPLDAYQGFRLKLVYYNQQMRKIFYTMKYAAKLREWMWRAKEQIAIRTWHPDNMWKMIEDADGDYLEVVLR